MFWRRLLLVLIVFCAWRNAPAQPLPTAEELGVDEAELSEQVRQGRLGKDELIRLGEEVGYFTKLRLYMYAKELEPFFEGVEDSFRELARTDPADKKATVQRLAALGQAMRTAYGRLASSGREQWRNEWRRGLLGLIFLDQDWRKRVYEQGKDEIKNPYDLVALVDCLDARLRGLEDGDLLQCPLRPASTDPPAGQTKAP